MVCFCAFTKWTSVLTLVSTLGAEGLAGAAPAIDLTLTPESTYTTGCVEPCACPVQLFPAVSGALTFSLSASNTLFSTYEVEAALTVPGDPPRSLRGAGTYKVGGEIATVQEMILDLSTDGGPAERFQSGSVPGGGDFPEALEISISVRQGVCFATAVAISARRSAPRPGDFVRGDCNADGSVDISDAVRGLLFLFVDGEDLLCADACDSNDDGKLDVSDAIATLTFLFRGGHPPSAPGPSACGSDPTGDSLDCASSSSCR